MKFTLFTALVVIVLLSSCKALEPDADLPKLGESVWKLTAINQKPASYGDAAFIKFDEKENKISGKAVCNSIFSDYEMIKQKVTFTEIGSTKMYCEGKMDDENQIITNLQKTTRYEVKADFLYLYAGEILLLTFKR